MSDTTLQPEELRSLLLDHFTNSMPSASDRDYAEHLLDRLVATRDAQHQRELELEDSIFDRAKANEVVKIERNGVTYHLSTFDGFVAGQQRVVDAALMLGVEMTNHKQRESQKQALLNNKEKQL